MLFRGAKAGAQALGRAALQTGSHILSGIADNPEGYKEIISKHLRETLPAKMAGGGRRKRQRIPSRTRQPQLKDANARFPHVVNGKHLSESESVAAVLNVGPL